MTRATIRDVAREAKLSVASVSRALNGLNSVTPETRDRVLAVADRLGYVPHAGARSLSLSRTHVIGVVLPDLHGEFFSELVRGMDRATAAHGYQMLFSTMHADAEFARQAIFAMHGRVDGLILMAPQVEPDRIQALLPRGTPVVLINSPQVIGRDALRIDNRGGAQAVVRHLIERGRRRIVHITGPVGNIDARERVDGFRVAIADLAPDLPAHTVEGNFQEQAGADAVARLVATGEPFDAIFAANDSMAFGALRALKAAGRRVPEDVAVAGFDDVPLARYLELTTMRVPLDAIGDRAVGQLVERLEGRVLQDMEMLIVPELIMRESTAARAEPQA